MPYLSDKIGGGTVKKASLYYFPYAGANTLSFKNLASYFPEEIEAVCIEYPGHGQRFEEPAAKSIKELAADSLSVISREAPIYLAGHCLGALAAYEAYHLLDKSGIRASGLIISGQGAPDSIISEHLQDMSETELLSYLAAHGIMDPKMADQRYRSFVSDLILEPITSDSLLYDSYSNDWTETVKSPLHILYGCEDSRYDVKALERWPLFASAGIRLYLFSGDHYFLKKTRRDTSKP